MREAAAIAAARFRAGIPGAVVVVVPVPAADELPPAVLEAGTAGRSLAANIALIKNNAAVGAAIAGELAGD